MTNTALGTLLGHDALVSFVDYDDHQKIVHVTDAASGLNAYIGIHNTNIGPSLGGCRVFKYAHDHDAIRDVLRLSRGMTYKNALAGLPLGGGKSVVIADPYKDKTEAMMVAMGRAVEELQGLYITAEDSGTSESDMETIRTQTGYVVGMRKPDESIGGNPSPVTAWGVYHALKAAAKRRYGSESLGDLAVAVQGLGAVGYELCRLLARDGTKLFATDIRPAVLERAQAEFPGIKIVGADDIFSAPAQIFSPCALGAQINDRTIPLLKADIVAGAANNQLAEARHEDMLAQRGILYAPDYVVNAGGVISAAYEYFYRAGRNPFSAPLSVESLMAHVEGIGPTLSKVFNIAEARNITPGRAADELAEAIFRRPAQTARHTG